MRGLGGSSVTCLTHAIRQPYFCTPPAAHARHTAKLQPLSRSLIRGGLSALNWAPSLVPPVVSFPTREDGLNRSRQLMRVAGGSSAMHSAKLAPPPASLPIGGEPPLWMGICCLLPVMIWGATWVCTVGTLHGAWASLWACTYLAATAWADIAPGSPPGTVDYTDMALRSIYGGQRFDPLGILHAPAHHQYSTNGQPWALDARIVRTLLPLAHQGWVAGRSVATGPGALPAVAVAQISLMAASAIFLTVQTPVGPILAALSRASKQLAASCAALANQFSKGARGVEGPAFSQECSMEGSSSSKTEGPGSASMSSSSTSGDVIAGRSVASSKMATGPVGGGGLRNALESTPAVAATPSSADGGLRPLAATSVAPPSSDADENVHSSNNPPRVPATLVRTAACLGLVALSTYIAASETSVPLMTGEWATQPVTYLFVTAIVVGDLALPAAVAAAAVASAVVGLWQSFWISRKSGTTFKGSRGSRTRGGGGCGSKGMDLGENTTTHEISGGRSSGPGSSSSSSSSSGSNSRSEGVGTQSEELRCRNQGRDRKNEISYSTSEGVDRESVQSNSSPSSPGPSQLNHASQLGQPSDVSAPAHPVWLSRLLLAIYATRGVLDVALTAAVAMGWLSGHVSAVRIVALLLLLRICWSERSAPSPRL